MGVYLSPGVYVKEKDISDVIANIAETSAALVGYSTKGDVDNIILVTTPLQFIQEYGEPTPGDYFHYSALAYLENGIRLYCYRVHKSALYGGVSIVKAGSIYVSEAFSAGRSANTFQLESSNPDVLFQIFGKDPGTWDNSISIKIGELDAVNYEFDITVYEKDVDGNDVVVEVWTVSRKTKVDGYGKQMYLETKINGYSKYITVADNIAMADTVMPPVVATLQFAGGSNGNAITSSELVAGWNKFINPDEVDIRLLINGGETDLAVQTKIKEVAEARKDCVAILDVPYDELASVAAMINWRTTTQNFNSSYVALYSPWVQIYDQWNDIIVDAPPSGYVASAMVYNDYVANPWYAPAGFNRGILNVSGLTNIFTQGERDSLYEDQINPLQTFRGEGIVVWGQKTEQTKASALDRVNVRRLLITIEKTIAAALRYYCFEPNTEVTRFRVVATCEEYLDKLSASNAFSVEAGDKGYRVLCDTTNNTPATIAANELHVDLFIKPAAAAEFIQLQAIVTTRGASFEELISRGIMW